MLPRQRACFRSLEAVQSSLQIRGYRAFHTTLHRNAGAGHYVWANKGPIERAGDLPVRRAFFYVPAHNPRFIEKALQSSADCIVLDLEDGVAPSQKDQARENISSLLKRLRNEGYQPGENQSAELCVRINHLGWLHTEWGSFKSNIRAPTADLDSDLELLVQPEARGLTIVLPKCKSFSNFEDVRKVLFDKRGLDFTMPQEQEEYRWIPIIENAEGIIELRKIARWRRLVVGLVFGAEDYCDTMNIPRTNDWTNINYARSAIVAAANANNITAIDLVCQDYKNNDILKQECENGVYMGFHGKQCVHPDQLETIQKSFAPQPEEVEWATRVLAAQRANPTKGAIQFEGKMIDMPVFRKAERIKNRHEFIKKHEDSKFAMP